MLQTEFAKLLLIVGNLAYDHKLINDILLRHTNERVRQSRGGAPSYPQSLWFCLLPFLFAARYGFPITPPLAANPTWQPGSLPGLPVIFANAILTARSRQPYLLYST
jgi:hypothetical protein